MQVAQDIQFCDHKPKLRQIYHTLLKYGHTVLHSAVFHGPQNSYHFHCSPLYSVHFYFSTPFQSPRPDSSKFDQCWVEVKYFQFLPCNISVIYSRIMAPFSSVLQYWLMSGLLYLLRLWYCCLRICNTQKFMYAESSFTTGCLDLERNVHSNVLTLQPSMTIRAGKPQGKCLGTQVNLRCGSLRTDPWRGLPKC